MRLLELEADLREARVNLAQAEADFTMLQAGPDPDQVALAESAHQKR